MSCKSCYRLNKTIIPLNYLIKLTPDFTNWTFKGIEEIELKVENLTEEIILNAVDIKVNKAIFEGEIGAIDYDIENERYKFTFKRLSSGIGKLILEFNGNLNDEMRGFYRSTYKDADNNEIKLAVTHFEPTDARRAFPCFDEPVFRATFDIILIVPSSKTALSNMPVKKKFKLNSELTQYEFERTPKMSTYIVAFVIGELDYVERKDLNGTLIRVYTAKDKSSRGKFALEFATKVLPFYVEYFNEPYSLPKLDLVAIPDFSIGAMENWGLVTYRETRLLIDDFESDLSRKESVALVIAHELSHMWYGNLVALEWWTDLWLKEGFASWIEYLGVDNIHPEFDVWTQFLSSDYERAIVLDSLESSHPIEITVHKPSEIDEIFDAISYSKGASIIRMLYDYMTPDVFKRGLVRYIDKYKFSNAITADLWQVLSDESSLDIGLMMDTWTKQSGFPVITVESIQDDQGNTTHVKLQQRKFSLNVHNNRLKSSQQYWIVPVKICALSQPSKTIHSVIMEPHDQPQIFQLAEPVPGLVRINPDAVGFYHTQYQEIMLPHLVQLIKEDKISHHDRFSLVVDYFALMRSGAVPLTKVLDFIRDGFNLETNYTVWCTLLKNMEIIIALADEMDSALRTNIGRFMIQLAEPAFRNIGGWELQKKSHNKQLLRPLLIKVLGRFGHQEVVQEAQRRFEKHYQYFVTGEGDDAQPTLTTDEVIPANLRSVIYSIVVQYDSERTFNMMLKLLPKTDLHEERMRLMTSLGYVSKNLVPRVFTFSLSDAVRKQDRFHVLSSTAVDAESREMLWHFIIQNWVEVQQKFTNSRLLGYLFKSFSKFAKKEQYERMKTFFDEHQVEFKRTVEQTLENIMHNIEQLNRDGDAIRSYFQGC